MTAPPVQDESPLTLAKPKPQPKALPGQQAAPGSPAPRLSLAPPTPAVPQPTVQAPQQPVDRVALAAKQFDTYQQARAPHDQRAREGVTSQAAGMGQLGSGQWRTALTNQDNERRLQLDTQRDALIQKATEGSIADASTAFQQALAGSQQGLASEIARGQLSIGQQQANTAEKGTTGQLALAEKSLDQSGAQFGQSLDLQKKAQEIDAAYKAGSMTLAQKDQALRELSNSQQFGLAGGQLELAKTGQTAAIGAEQQRIALAAKQQEIEQAYQSQQITLAQKDQALRELSNQQNFGLAGQQLELAKSGQAQQGEQFGQSLAFQKEQAAIDAAYKAGTMTLAQKDQALRELSNSQQFGLQTGQLELAREGQNIQQDQFGRSLAEQTAGRLQQESQFDRSLAQNSTQFAQSLAQNAQQFGLSQEQAMALAKLNDATQNRQIDVNEAQGKNQVLIQLASILGGPTGTLNNEALRSIAKAFGIVIPERTTTLSDGSRASDDDRPREDANTGTGTGTGRATGQTDVGF